MPESGNMQNSQFFSKSMRLGLTDPDPDPWDSSPYATCSIYHQHPDIQIPNPIPKKPRKNTPRKCANNMVHQIPAAGLFNSVEFPSGKNVGFGFCFDLMGIGTNRWSGMDFEREMMMSRCGKEKVERR